jgi:thioredoxin-like negative regulator of GroEL
MDSVAGAAPDNRDAGRPWWVVCLCAQWCGVCNQYQSAFAQLAAQFPGMRFVWLDVEDREDVAGDLDIETFPSILVADGERARFLGPVLPQAGVVARMLQSLAQDPGAAPADPEVAGALLRRLQAAGDLQILR